MDGYSLTNIINKTHKPVEKKIKIKKEVKQFIIELYKTNPFYTRQEIQSLIKTKFNLKLSLKKLRKIINVLGFTYKKAKYLVIKNRNYIDELKEKRIKFKENIESIDIKQLIFIDESSFNSLYGSNMKGHSIKGTQLLLPINEKKFKNHSLLMALSIEKIINYEIHENKINSEIFINFIKKIIDDNQLNNYTFVFDNVSFHQKKEVLNLILSSGNKYLFTPPYSPNNNPIENMFGIIKKEYHKQIINDIVNKNILSSSEFKLIKINNKIKLTNIKLTKIENEKNKINDKLNEIKENNIDVKKSKLDKIIKNEKRKLKQELNFFKKKEEKDLKIKLKENNMSNIIKIYINKTITITIIKSNYTYEKINKIIKHSINYSYNDIEKEIRDRIIFLRN